MPRKSPSLILEHFPGERFPDLVAAQQLALPLLSSGLATMIRALLAAGVLVNEGGSIKPR